MPKGCWANDYESFKTFANGVLNSKIGEIKVKSNVKGSKDKVISKQGASNNDKQVAWLLPCCL